MAVLRSHSVSTLRRLEIEAPCEDWPHRSRCVPGIQLRSVAALTTGERVGICKRSPVAPSQRQDSLTSPLRGHYPNSSHLSSFPAMQKFGRGLLSRACCANLKNISPVTSLESDDEDGRLEFAQGELAKGTVAREKSIVDIVWPYIQLARLDKPFGNWAMIFLSYWAISLATPAGALPEPSLLGVFALIMINIRSAMCTLNDIIDMDLDAQVERSKTRPLPSGAITRMQGIGFFLAQMVVYWALVLQLNHMTRILFALYVPMCSIYPLMKRITFYPQGYLSLCIAWPVLAGWAGVNGTLDRPAAFLPAFATSALWMFLLDTIYAHADKTDDAKAGVKSTARLFGDNAKSWLSMLCAACAGGLAFTGLNNDLGWPFFAGSAAALAHLAWTVFAVNLDNPKDCIAKFLSNSYVFSSLVFVAIASGKLA